MNLSHRFRHTVFAWLPFLGICFLVINHAIGVMGLNSEIHKQDFENISWLNLLLSFILVFVFQRPLHNRLLLFAVLAFCIGMVAEMLGVNTTFPFGSYYYTEKFGPQILGGACNNWDKLGIVKLLLWQFYRPVYPLQVVKGFISLCAYACTRFIAGAICYSP
jgi:hypothetical protein